MIQDYKSNIDYYILNRKSENFFVIRYSLKNSKNRYEIHSKSFYYKAGTQLEVKHYIEINALSFISQDIATRGLVSTTNLTISKIINLFLDEKEFGQGVRASTSESNKAILNKYLLGTLKNARLSQFDFKTIINSDTALLIKQAINHGSYNTKENRKKEINQSRKQRIYNLLIEFFNFCRRSKFITAAQAEEIIDSFPSKIIVHDQKEVGNNYLTINEMQTFLNTFDKEDEIWRMFFYIMFKTGLRIGENMALKFSDINIEEHSIRIHSQVDKHGKYIDHTKTAKSTADVNLDPKDIQELLKYQKEIYAGPNEFIFFGTTHTSYTNAKRILNKHLKMGNLKTITLHGFRHSICVFLCSQNIMTLPEISKFMRHDSIEVTVKYYAKWIKIDEHIKDNYSKSFSEINIH